MTLIVLINAKAILTKRLKNYATKNFVGWMHGSLVDYSSQVAIILHLVSYGKGKYIHL